MYVTYADVFADILVQYCIRQSTQLYQDRSGQSYSELFRNGYNFILFKCKKVFKYYVRKYKSPCCFPI